MKTKLTISLIKKLLQINKTRVFVYKEAYKDTQFKDLKRVFLKYITTSKSYNIELIQIINNLGGSALMNSSIKRYLFILYMKLNIVFFNYGRRTILDFCTYCEFVVKKKYNYVLNKKNIDNLSFPNQTIIKKQQNQILKEQAEVSSFRDNSV